MPDPFAFNDPFATFERRKPKSAFLSVLDEIDKPGQVVRNLLSGNLEGAGRQLVDFVSAIPRAILPGDQSNWELAREQDNIHGSDLLGIDREAHPLGAIAADIPIDIATDPLTYLTFGASVPIKAAARAAAATAEAANVTGKSAEAINAARRVADLANEGVDIAGNATKGGVGFGIPFTKIQSRKILQGHNVDPLALVGQGIEKAASYLPKGGRDAYEALKLGAKSTLGYLNPAPAIAKIMQKASTKGANVEQSGLLDIERMMKDSTPQQREDMFYTIQNVKKNPDGTLEVLSDIGEKNPLYNQAENGIKPEFAGTGGNVRTVTPEDSLMVKKPGMARDIDPLASDVGIEGVAFGDASGLAAANAQHLNPLSPVVGRFWDPRHANAAAGRTLEQAFPLSPTDPRFASGIERANNLYRTPQNPLKGVRTFGPDANLAAAIPGIPADPLAVKQAADLISPMERAKALGAQPDPLSSMLGAVGPEVPGLGRAEVPTSITDKLSEMMGGTKAATETVGARALPEVKKTFSDIEDQISNWQKRIDLLDRPQEYKDLLKEKLADYGRFVQQQFKEGIQDFPAFSKPIGQDIERQSPVDYAPRQFTGVTTQENRELMGNPNTLKERTLKSDQSFVDYANANKDLKLTSDLGEAMVNRAGQQGRLAQRATLGKELLGDGFKSLNDPDSMKQVGEVIEGFAKHDPETYTLLKKQWEGMEPRGPFMQAIANASKLFKPAATYGLAFPRVSGIMRNIIAFPTQILAQEGQPIAAAGAQVLRTPQTVWHAMSEGVNKAFGLSIPTGEIGKASDVIESAFRASKGRASVVPQILRQQGREDLALAVEHGVVDNGFVKKEAVYDSLKNSAWGRKIMSMVGMGKKAQDKAFDIIDAPAAAWQGAEQHGRLGNFLDLLKRGSDNGNVHEAPGVSQITGEAIGGATRASIAQEKASVQSIVSSKEYHDPVGLSAALIGSGKISQKRATLLSEVAKRANEFGVKIGFGKFDGSGAAGYHQTSNKIIVDLDKIESGILARGDVSKSNLHHLTAQVVTHELVHGITSRVLDIDHKFRNQVSDILRRYTDISKDTTSYGVKDVHEFLSEAISNRSFQDKLRAVKIGGESIFAKFVDIIKDVLGKLGIEAPSRSILEEAVGAFDYASQRSGVASNWEKLRPKDLVYGSQPIGHFTPEQAAEAAKLVRDSFYDYSIFTEKNRTLRTILPFAAFTTSAVKQQGKFLSRNLGVAEGLNSVYNQPDSGPVDPYLQSQLRIPTGKDELGNDQYIAGLNLPVEALNQIPNVTGTSLPGFGQELRRTALSSTQPLLKTGYGVLSGRDPFFDSQFGSYDKIPGIGHAGDTGKVYNLLAGTGLLQPLTTPAGTIGRLLDDRTSFGDKLANELTGAKFVSVDPQRALQRQLEDVLANSPDVQQHHSFYQQSKDPQTQALIAAYNRAKKAAKDKRKSQPSQ